MVGTGGAKFGAAPCQGAERSRRDHLAIELPVRGSRKAVVVEDMKD